MQMRGKKGREPGTDAKDEVKGRAQIRRKRKRGPCIDVQEKVKKI